MASSYRTPYRAPAEDIMLEIRNAKEGFDDIGELSPRSRKRIIEKYKEKRGKRIRLDESEYSSDRYSTPNTEKPLNTKRFLETPFAQRIQTRITLTKRRFRKFGKKLKSLLKSEANGNILIAVDKESKIYYS